MNQGLLYAYPTEVVCRDGDSCDIASMLNKRYANNWILDRIIDHQDTTLVAGTPHPPPSVVYYFTKI